MNTNESQFPTSNVKVVTDPDEQYGYGPEEYKDVMGEKLDVTGNTDSSRAKAARSNDHFLAIRNRKDKEAGNTPVVKIRTNG
jgi:hypothetical protein